MTDVSTTALVTYKSGKSVTRVFNGVANIADLLDQIRQGAERQDGKIAASTTDGHDCVVDCHAIEDIQVEEYNLGT